MKHVQFLLNTLYALYEMPMSCFCSDKLCFNLGTEMQDDNLFILDSSLHIDLIKKWQDLPFLELEDKKILYGVCMSNQITCIVGPVAINNISGQELHQYKIKHNLTAYNDFRIPYGSIVKTAAVLALLHKELNQVQIEAVQIMKHIHEKDSHVQISEKDIRFYQFQNSEERRIHNSYQNEKEVMTAISNGNMAALVMPKDYNSLDKIGVMAKTPYKQLEYMTVSAISLSTRAAIEGGVNPEAAYNLSDLYLQSAAQCKDELELIELVQNAMKAFCQSVIDAKAKYQGVKYIEQCKRYVARNLYRTFTLDELAESVGNNKCYLTHQFSLHEGKSLKRYIHEERVRAAQHMLKYSDQPIPVIANYLCFGTQSHFGSVFKKITGTSPALYRSQNAVEGFYH